MYLLEYLLCIKYKKKEKKEERGLPMHYIENLL